MIPGLSKIFAGGAGEVIEKVGGVVDNLIPSKEETLLRKNELVKIWDCNIDLPYRRATS